MTIHALIAELHANPIFAGLVGTMLMGSALYALRTAPVKLGHWLYDALTVTLVINSDDGVFDWVNEWLSRHEYAKRARRLKLTTGRSSSDEWTLAPGFGMHLLWDRGPVLLERLVNDKQPTSAYRINETFKITTFGRGQSRLRELIERANDVRRREDNLGLRVWQGGYWQPLPSRPKRPIDTVFLPEAQKAEILRDVEWFFGAREWYASRGLSHRRGHLYYGIPRTGKTTLVTAIASHFARPIYIINLATVKNDNELLQAFLTAGVNAIILIEDVDCIGVAHKRVVETKPTGSPLDVLGKAPAEVAEGVTLSGLLNAIDGVTASDGRLLCMTTNHIDKLDPALIGEARIDKRFEIGPLTPRLVEVMAERFFPDRPEIVDRVVEDAVQSLPRPAAYWQDKLMEVEIDGDVVLREAA
jgi:chaperone BCS1